jgi:hypothetical protein
MDMPHIFQRHEGNSIILQEVTMSKENTLRKMICDHSNACCAHSLIGQPCIHSGKHTEEDTCNNKAGCCIHKNARCLPVSNSSENS